MSRIGAQRHRLKLFPVMKTKKLEMSSRHPNCVISIHDETKSITLM